MVPENSLDLEGEQEGEQKLRPYGDKPDLEGLRVVAFQTTTAGVINSPEELAAKWKEDLQRKRLQTDIDIRADVEDELAKGELFLGADFYELAQDNVVLYVVTPARLICFYYNPICAGRISYPLSRVWRYIRLWAPRERGAASQFNVWFTEGLDIRDVHSRDPGEDVPTDEDFMEKGFLPFRGREPTALGELLSRALAHRINEADRAEEISRKGVEVSKAGVRVAEAASFIAMLAIPAALTPVNATVAGITAVVGGVVFLTWLVSKAKS